MLELESLPAPAPAEPPLCVEAAELDGGQEPNGSIAGYVHRRSFRVTLCVCDKATREQGEVMADMSWLPVAGAAVGAVIALAGTLVTSIRADRTQRSRDRESERLKTYIDFAQALETTHGALRVVARSAPDDPDRSSAAGQAVHDSGIYGVRERLLMSGTAELVEAGETAFGRLIGVRDAVRGGAVLSGRAYHDAYHAYAEALWTFRVTARRALGQRPITPGELGRVSWSEREQCPECRLADASG